MRTPVLLNSGLKSSGAAWIINDKTITTRATHSYDDEYARNVARRNGLAWERLIEDRTHETMQSLKFS